MEPLPQPPQAYDDHRPARVRPRRAGELTAGWRTVYAIGWIGVVLGYAAVWKSARTLGLPVWWLGPEAAARPLPIQLLPFAPAVALIVAATRSVRRLPWLGLVGSIVLVVIALPDLDRYPGLAALQLALALAGAFVSIAALAGVLRPAANRQAQPAG